MLAIVGHGDMMQHVCGLDSKPANNAVYRRRILVEDDKIREEPGSCELVMSAPEKRPLSPHDADRCLHPFPVSPFLGRPQLGHGKHECRVSPRDFVFDREFRDEL